jgi:hypothetical protein
MPGVLKAFADFWTSDVKQHKRGLGITAILVLMGYVGAAYFHDYLLGLHPALNLYQFRFICPPCGCMLTVGGSPVGEFIRRMFGFGTVNAIVFVAVGWLLIAAYKGARRIFSSTQI